MAYDLGNLSNVTNYLNQYQGYTPNNGSMGMPSQGWDGWSGYNAANTYNAPGAAAQSPQSASAGALPSPQLNQRGGSQLNGAPRVKAPWEMPTLPTNTQYSLDQVSGALNQFNQARSASQGIQTPGMVHRLAQHPNMVPPQPPRPGDQNAASGLDQRSLYHSYLRANGLMQNFGTPGSYVNYDYGQAAPWMQYLTGNS